MRAKKMRGSKTLFLRILPGALSRISKNRMELLIILSPERGTSINFVFPLL